MDAGFSTTVTAEVNRSKREPAIVAAVASNRT
jgi:hypothetical protein